MATSSLSEPSSPPAVSSESPERWLPWDRNATVHVLFLGATAGAVWLVGWAGLVLYPVLQILSDVLYYRFAVEVFDPSVTIARGYAVSLAFNDTPHSVGLDYGFNFYDGNYEKTRQEAQRDKFDYAYEELQLAPGMRLIDIGCGCGDWLSYLRDRGVEVMGVNITGAQVAMCRKRGLRVLHTDWKAIESNPDLCRELYGTFNRVTFWDTVEHYVPMKHRTNLRERDAI